MSTTTHNSLPLSLLKSEMQDVLENNILRFWLDKMQDHEHGGFYGRIDGHGRLYPEAEKGAILNARILWAFSAAYRVLRHQCYLEAATRAKDYIIDHFIDPEYGGVYWSLDYMGRPLDTKKQFYAIGFAIYGLAEYARATGDREALDYALMLFDCIEEHALDREHNGYIEAMTRDWQPIADMRLSDLDANYPKSQNTHLHIIEPYTNLLQAMREMQAAQDCAYVPVIGSVLPIDIAVPPEYMIRVQAALRNLIDIFTDRILNPETHHLDLFFDMDWTRPSGNPSPSGEMIGSLGRLESYGHDIECSWLLHEAALVLGDNDVLRRVEPIVCMVAEASAKGLRPDGSLIHEANLDTGYVDDDRHWWVQAENVVGWMNIYQHFGDDTVPAGFPAAADSTVPGGFPAGADGRGTAAGGFAVGTALRCWDYIKHNLIDYEHGEWYWSRHADGTLNLDDDHAGFWKCPYHNSRMCLEIIQRF